MLAALKSGLALLAGTALAGCLTLPGMPAADPNAKPVRHIEEGPIRMSEGFNPILLDIIDDARRVRIYTQMNHIGDPQNDQLLFPAAVTEQLGLTNSQMNRRLMDALLRTQRFEVLDPDYTGGTQGGARQKWGRERADIVVDCQVVDARQEIIDISPYRKIRTEVKLSVHMINRRTGANLFDGDVSVEGSWGDVQGEGTMLAPNVSLESPAIQQSLGGDYERALSKAFEEAVERIEELVRPVGRVTYADARGLSMFGGIQHGFQGGDEVIVFRAHKRRMPDGHQRVFRIEPLAVARCDGVGSDITQCDLTRIEPGASPRDGDYTVLSDQSAASVRRR